MANAVTELLRLDRANHPAPGLFAADTRRPSPSRPEPAIESVRWSRSIWIGTLASSMLATPGASPLPAGRSLPRATCPLDLLEPPAGDADVLDLSPAEFPYARGKVVRAPEDDQRHQPAFHRRPHLPLVPCLDPRRVQGQHLVGNGRFATDIDGSFATKRLVHPIHTVRRPLTSPTLATSGESAGSDKIPQAGGPSPPGQAALPRTPP